MFAAALSYTIRSDARKRCMKFFLAFPMENTSEMRIKGFFE